MSRRGETRRVLENDEKENGSVLSEFPHFGFLSSFDIACSALAGRGRVVHDSLSFAILMSWSPYKFFQIKFVAICWKLV
jgi:hypothetical protein